MSDDIPLPRELRHPGEIPFLVLGGLTFALIAVFAGLLVADVLGLRGLALVAVAGAGLYLTGGMINAREIGNSDVFEVGSFDLGPRTADPAALDFIIAHELGHVAARHTTPS